MIIRSHQIYLSQVKALISQRSLNLMQFQMRVATKKRSALMVSGAGTSS